MKYFREVQVVKPQRESIGDSIDEHADTDKHGKDGTEESDDDT